MEDISTLDTDIVIESVGGGATPFVVYRRLSTGERWRVNGTCNQCGLCVIGVAHTENYIWNGPPGTPMAVTDVRVLSGRLDEPITPSFSVDMEKMAQETETATVSGCSLTIESV